MYYLKSSPFQTIVQRVNDEISLYFAGDLVSYFLTKPEDNAYYVHCFITPVCVILCYRLNK